MKKKARQIDEDDSFIPQGASRRWPFVIGTDNAYQRPPWNAHLLLWWGLTEALLGIQPNKSRENWRILPRERLRTHMRKEGAGKQHASRIFAASLLKPGDGVLDVGCGTGVNYETLLSSGLAAQYVGIDSSEPSIEIARELFPSAEFYVANASGLVSLFGERAFDVVLVRHVLEHLPDFETAMHQAITVSRRLAVFVFYLSPRALPFNVRKIEAGHMRPHFYSNIYSRSAINRFLAQGDLQAEWHDRIGVSRAGWFANEMNSVLVVRRNKVA